MDTSSFEHIVRIQFDALMMTAIKCTVKSRKRQFARHSKREVFSLNYQIPNYYSAEQQITILMIILL